MLITPAVRCNLLILDLDSVNCVSVLLVCVGKFNAFSNNNYLIWKIIIFLVEARTTIRLGDEFFSLTKAPWDCRGKGCSDVQKMQHKTKPKTKNKQTKNIKSTNIEVKQIKEYQPRQPEFPPEFLYPIATRKVSILVALTIHWNT